MAVKEAIVAILVVTVTVMIQALLLIEREYAYVGDGNNGNMVTVVDISSACNHYYDNDLDNDY